ncbi:MAG: hypothetical protein JKY46_09210 [Robiginitomaculum sp.]|nr:hypothetical protein [Robiginitomaculum sp.]
MQNNRHDDIIRFYDILSRLKGHFGGNRQLRACAGRLSWPMRGVYFFFEPGEVRTDSGDGLRVVRIGTHALKNGSKTTLWNRLSQHKGTVKSGGGNHRGSIFRLIVGTADQARQETVTSSWGKGSSAPREIRDKELHQERRVSQIIGNMPFLWLPIEDSATPESLRGVIERNSIALLSNFEKQKIDPPSLQWLGGDCDRKRVRLSGLWNSNHVNEDYNPDFLNVFDRLVQEME